MRVNSPPLLPHRAGCQSPCVCSAPSSRASAEAAGRCSHRGSPGRASPPGASGDGGAPGVPARPAARRPSHSSSRPGTAARRPPGVVSLQKVQRSFRERRTRTFSFPAPTCFMALGVHQPGLTRHEAALASGGSRPRGFTPPPTPQSRETARREGEKREEEVGVIKKEEAKSTPREIKNLRSGSSKNLSGFIKNLSGSCFDF